MRIEIAPRARRDLVSQLDYLIERGAGRAARRLEQRLGAFLENTLAEFPRTGTYLAHRQLWESWVPGTRLVVWYRIEPDLLQIARIWHASQHRDAVR